MHVRYCTRASECLLCVLGVCIKKVRVRVRVNPGLTLNP